MQANSLAYQIFIPTRDSANWLPLIVQFYKARHLSPLFIVDTRTVDGTRDIIRSAGLDFLEFSPRGDFPEAGMIEFGAQNCSTDWVLRLDDDELPSARLIAWAQEIAATSRNQCWFIPRKELFLDQGRVFYSRSPGKYPIVARPEQLHPMARLFHRRRVRYLEEVHTTGFEELKLYNFAPPESCIVHLNCLVHKTETRLNKIIFYHGVKPGQSWQLADEYLPELFSLNHHNPADDGLEEFASVFSQLAARQPKEMARLSEADRDVALREVLRRANELAAKRLACGVKEGELRRHIDADAVAWIALAPRSWRRAIARILCTLLPSNCKVYGAALWNVLDFLE